MKIINDHDHGDDQQDDDHDDQDEQEGKKVVRGIFPNNFSILSTRLSAFLISWSIYEETTDPKMIDDQYIRGIIDQEVTLTKMVMRAKPFFGLAWYWSGRKKWAKKKKVCAMDWPGGGIWRTGDRWWHRFCLHWPDYRDGYQGHDDDDGDDDDDDDADDDDDDDADDDDDDYDDEVDDDGVGVGVGHR